MALDHKWQLKDRIGAALATAALIASTVSAVASWRSSAASARSADAASAALLVQQRPVVIAHCGFLRTKAADYLVPLDPKLAAGSSAFIPTYGAFPPDKGRDYEECDFQNLGQYPVLNLQPKFLVQFQLTDKLGNGNGADRNLELPYSGQIDAIGARDSRVVLIYNDDPCLKATVSLQQQVSLLGAPYEKPTADISIPGWTENKHSLLPTDVMRDGLLKPRGHLFENECKNQ